jgi:hypothetical protein
MSWLEQLLFQEVGNLLEGHKLELELAKELDGVSAEVDHIPLLELDDVEVVVDRILSVVVGDVEEEVHILAVVEQDDESEEVVHILDVEEKDDESAVEDHIP